MGPSAPRADHLAMGDGRTFEQALRALDKLVAEQSRSDIPDANSPIRRAYERIVSGASPSLRLA
jgi:hypothetical protein